MQWLHLLLLLDGSEVLRGDKLAGVGRNVVEMRDPTGRTLPADRALQGVSCRIRSFLRVPFGSRAFTLTAPKRPDESFKLRLHSGGRYANFQSSFGTSRCSDTKRDGGSDLERTDFSGTSGAPVKPCGVRHGSPMDPWPKPRYCPIRLHHDRPGPPSAVLDRSR